MNTKIFIIFFFLLLLFNSHAEIMNCFCSFLFFSFSVDHSPKPKSSATTTRHPLFDFVIHNRTLTHTHLLQSPAFFLLLLLGHHPFCVVLISCSLTSLPEPKTFSLFAFHKTKKKNTESFSKNEKKEVKKNVLFFIISLLLEEKKCCCKIVI